jgi:DNA-binding protein Fis
VATDAGLALESVEKKLMAEAMERTQGNQSRAARLLGAPATLCATG